MTLYGEVACQCGEYTIRVYEKDVVTGSCEKPCYHLGPECSCGGVWRELNDVVTIHSIFSAVYRCDKCGATRDVTDYGYSVGEETGEDARDWSCWEPKG